MRTGGKREASGSKLLSVASQDLVEALFIRASASAVAQRPKHNPLLCLGD